MDMEDRETYSDLLFKYFTGKLTAEEDQQLLVWLKESEEHKNVLSQMADWWAVVHIPLFKSDLENDFRAHFEHLLSDKSSSADFNRPQFRYPFSKRWINIAASLLILLGAGLGIYYLDKQNTQPTVLTYYERITAYGDISEIRLPDSSLVILNAGSVLRYKSDYNQKNRTVELTGEAYFEVKSDVHKPFIVCSEGLNVCVKGTSFNVMAYDEENGIDVTLITGRIDIQFEDKTKKDITLSPKQHLAYDKNNQKAIISKSANFEEILWTKGIIAFTEKPFTQIAKQLERKFNTPIKVNSSVLQNEVFSGTFSPDYSLDRILKEIDMEKKYRWYHEQGTLIIADK
jgi:transmembrane sensor